MSTMTSAEAAAVTDCRCAGTGAIRWADPAGDEVRIGDTVVQNMGASGSTLCPCRMALAPREGEARWWSLEVIHAATVNVPIFNEAVEISVDAEVPIDGDNYRVVRRGNRYYPTLIEVESPRSMTLHPGTARELALALIAAADAADAIDQADLDTCGHWAPCDCQAKPS